MNIFKYCATFRNCNYQIVTMTGYTIASDAQVALHKVEEEYGEDSDIQIAEVSVIEL